MRGCPKVGVIIAGLLPALALAQAPKGKPVDPTPEEAAKLAAIKGKVKGKIIWATSREGNHKLWVMNADGTDPKPLTKGTKTDWYARWSPDGKRVLFMRSKLDWGGQETTDFPERWDTWMINADGSGEKLVAHNATWATWRPDGKHIVYSRGKDVFTANDDGSGEKEIINGDKELKGGIAQNPNMSDDGKFVAITLRGSQRETGIFNMETRKWFRSGTGCQINFFPGTHHCFRINQTGNGGTQVFHFELSPEGTHGEISGNKIGDKDIRLMDLPGRRSHEYFPKTDQHGKYLVWGATQYGHDEDIVDYEIFIWKVGDPSTWDKATRLTFHSGNDRWPDLYLED